MCCCSIMCLVWAWNLRGCEERTCFFLNSYHGSYVSTYINSIFTPNLYVVLFYVPNLIFMVVGHGLGELDFFHYRASFQHVRIQLNSNHLMPKERKKPFWESWNWTQAILPLPLDHGSSVSLWGSFNFTPWPEPIKIIFSIIYFIYSTFLLAMSVM